MAVTPTAGAPPAADAASVYRKQVTLARGDGRIGVNERMMLRDLRKSLNLTSAEADEIEAEVEEERLRSDAEAPA